MSDYHVTKNKEAREWEVKKAGADRISGAAQTQRDAERMAKEFAANSGGGEVRIHGRDGRIRDSDTVPPGNDPYPPKDRKH